MPMRSLWFFAMVMCACGSDSKTKIDAPAGGGDAPHDAKAIDAKVADAPLDGPPGTFLLTVKNFDMWCSVSVNGGSASSAPSQQVFVLPGDIPLTATKASDIFEVGSNMWHHTKGDAGSGEKGMWSTTDPTTATSSATVTVGSAAKCAWVCCPFKTGGTGCESTVPDQCQ